MRNSRLLLVAELVLHHFAWYFHSTLQILHKPRNRNSHFDAILLHHLANLVFSAEKDPRTVDSHPFLKAFESSLVGCC